MHIHTLLPGKNTVAVDSWVPSRAQAKNQWKHNAYACLLNGCIVSPAARPSQRHQPSHRRRQNVYVRLLTGVYEIDCRVAIQCLAPTELLANTGELKGPVSASHRVLESLGWQVIPFVVTSDMASAPARTSSAYLYDLLKANGVPLPEQAPEDEPPAAGDDATFEGSEDDDIWDDDVDEDQEDSLAYEKVRS